MRVAVLGTGIMGAAMARSLRREGHEVIAWNRTRERAEGLGVDVADSVSEAVSGADAVITMLFDLDATLAVREQLLAALGESAVWLQTGTVGPDGAERLAADRMLDAPVLGTKKPAEDGKLVVLVAGPDELVRTAQPVFDAIGSRTIVVASEIGKASALKLACNAWVGLITAGTAQSLAFAAALGVDPELFLQAIEGGPTDSAYAQLKGKAILGEDYSTSFAVDGVVKDIALMIDAANAAQFPTEMLEAVHAMFARASAAGHGEKDMASVRLAFG